MEECIREARSGDLVRNVCNLSAVSKGRPWAWLGGDHKGCPYRLGSIGSLFIATRELKARTTATNFERCSDELTPPRHWGGIRSRRRSSHRILI